MILDTDFLIDLMHNNESAARRKQKLNEEIETPSVSTATIFELWAGIFMSRKSDEEKRKVTGALGGIRAVGLSQTIAERAGELHGLLKKEGNDIGVIDTMIAATALTENEILLTNNAKHFSRIKGLRIEGY